MADLHFYYFGCMHHAGHYVFPAGDAPPLRYDQQPWPKLDGGLQPRGQEIEGHALVHHKDGWTAVSFWDRSVDRRGRSNSSFLANRTLDFGQMMALACAEFPHVVGRFNFPIIDVTPTSSKGGSQSHD